MRRWRFVFQSKAPFKDFSFTLENKIKKNALFNSISLSLLAVQPLEEKHREEEEVGGEVGGGGRKAAGWTRAEEDLLQ